MKGRFHVETRKGVAARFKKRGGERGSAKGSQQGERKKQSPYLLLIREEQGELTGVRGGKRRAVGRAEKKLFRGLANAKCGGIEEKATEKGGFGEEKRIVGVRSSHAKKRGEATF